MDLNWALNITVFSDDYRVLQKMDRSLAGLFGIQSKRYKKLRNLTKQGKGSAKKICTGTLFRKGSKLIGIVFLRRKADYK